LIHDISKILFLGISLITPPKTIDVRITGDTVCYSGIQYETVTLDFRQYVKGVLPNEWHGDWHTESLRAGAVAVKMYAWQQYRIKGYVWDCNWDQVYRPSFRTNRTDRAVDDTWNVILWGDRIYYDDYPNACLSRGQTENCMSQWVTLEQAERGMNHLDILLSAYDVDVLIIPADVFDNNP